MAAGSDNRGERELVQRLGALLGNPVTGGIPFGDDMAGLGPAGPGRQWLWTVDMLMDGVDFESGRHSWREIGRKALAVNLSDCAAMAVVPVAALLAVALDNRLRMEDALELAAGAQELGLRYGCPIVGGDTNSWDRPTVISISAAARALDDAPPVRRDGARAGDGVWLTGPVGGSILGRHMTFEPQLERSWEIARRLHPHAMIDISDGLALDLGRILEASGCGAVLDEAGLGAAIHPDAVRLAQRDGQPAREHALHDGEDFELVVVLPGGCPSDECRALGLLPLGSIVNEPELYVARPDGGRTAVPLRGWEHFR